MRYLPYFYVLSVLCCTAFTSCRNQRQLASADADTLDIRHARYLMLIEHPAYTEVQIRNPWNEERLLQTLYLQKEEGQEAVSLDGIAGMDVLPRPRRAVCFTTAHSSLAEQLGAVDAIAGICETEYVANPRLREAITQGSILDLGSAMKPDREKIIHLQTDAILLSPYENAGTYGGLEALGIPIIQCADYMETTALGRAEWMRFYGRLFGKGREADSLFQIVEARYDTLCALVVDDDALYRPDVLFDTKNGSAWYVPGGRSTMSKLVTDAGGRYVFDDIAKSGSIPLSFETVLHHGEQADVWLVRYNNRRRMNLSELGKVYHPYTLFKAYREGEVYGCNSAELIFYEETPFRPDLLLRDYMKILHPELLPGDTLRYFHKL